MDIGEDMVVVMAVCCVRLMDQRPVPLKQITCYMLIINFFNLKNKINKKTKQNKIKIKSEKDQDLIFPCTLGPMGHSLTSVRASQSSGSNLSTMGFLRTR